MQSPHDQTFLTVRLDASTYLCPLMLREEDSRWMSNGERERFETKEERRGEEINDNEMTSICLDEM